MKQNQTDSYVSPLVPLKVLEIACWVITAALGVTIVCRVTGII